MKCKGCAKDISAMQNGDIGTWNDQYIYISTCYGKNANTVKT